MFKSNLSNKGWILIWLHNHICNITVNFVSFFNIFRVSCQILMMFCFCINIQESGSDLLEIFNRVMALDCFYSISSYLMDEF